MHSVANALMEIFNYSFVVLFTKSIQKYTKEENFHCNLNFAISLMANSLNLNTAYYIFRNLSMIAYIYPKSKIR